MKILTISVTPYNINRSAKMNATILKYLKSLGHEVSSMVYNHDVLWFAPSEDGRFYYEDSGKVVCELYPFDYKGANSSPAAYELVRLTQPDVVITIGDYNETDFFHAVKMLNQDKFKWINILTIDSLPISKSRESAFSYPDVMITTTREAKEAIEKITNTKNVYFLPFGPDTSIFQGEKVESSKFSIISCMKNTIYANWYALLSGVSLAQKTYSDIELYLHVNISDRGFYDIKELIEQFDVKVRLPEKYIGHNDGLTDEELRQEYLKADMIVDVSMQSATGLSALEGMSCGCIPSFSNIGAFKEICGELKLGAIISSDNFICNNLGEMCNIVSASEVCKDIILYYDMKKKEIEKFNAIKEGMINLSKKYDVIYFNEGLKEIIENLNNINKEFVLESF